MNGFGGWFRQLGERLRAGIRHFMMGRYGVDKLNLAILGVGAAACLLSAFLPFAILKLALVLLSYFLMGVSFFRMLSRNTYKRYQENRRYLMFLQRIKDREHRYYDCPRCRQPVRVPRGKGKLAITCPKCKEKFIRKT